ncbi:hypothetical protein AB0B63_06845 [Micromonospora sp. NPDC049081]|uniref:hypothetical protein n=1 Tax=Micromonospora sp. NPDC049081 TaxID=3155150 RepID=UPI0033FAB0AF
MADPTAERITSAISEAIRHGELGNTNTGMPAGWVLVANYHDEDGDIRTAFLTADGQRLHETLGLLDTGQTVWREQLRRWVLGDE